MQPYLQHIIKLLSYRTNVQGRILTTYHIIMIQSQDSLISIPNKGADEFDNLSPLMGNTPSTETINTSDISKALDYEQDAPVSARVQPTTDRKSVV